MGYYQGASAKFGKALVEEQVAALVRLAKEQDACPVAEEAFTRRFTHLPLYRLTSGQLEYLANAVIASVEAVRNRKGRRKR